MEVGGVSGEGVVLIPSEVESERGRGREGEEEGETLVDAIERPHQTNKNTRYLNI